MYFFINAVISPDSVPSLSFRATLKIDMVVFFLLLPLLRAGPRETPSSR